MTDQLELALFGPKPKPPPTPKRRQRPKPKPKPKARAPRYEWVVRYRRRWWPHTQGHVFQSLPPTVRLIEKLRSPRRLGDLEPIVQLYVQRRVVGEWEDVPLDQVIAAYQPKSHKKAVL